VVDDGDDGGSGKLARSGLDSSSRTAMRAIRTHIYSI
jgi:hypothetical protein